MDSSKNSWKRRIVGPALVLALASPALTGCALEETTMTVQTRLSAVDEIVEALGRIFGHVDKVPWEDVPDGYEYACSATDYYCPGEK